MKKTKADLTAEQLNALEKSVAPRVLRHLEDIYATKCPDNFQLFAVGRKHDGKELVRDCSIELLWDRKTANQSTTAKVDTELIFFHQKKPTSESRRGVRPASPLGAR
jgi:hypothetical protein